MSFNTLLPFVSAGVMLVFTVLVLRRFFVVKGGRRAYYLLLWGIGLLFYFTGSLAEVLHTTFGWSPFNYRLWYLTGAVLVAAWLGQGTAELLIRRRVGGVRLSHIMLAVLTAASLFAMYRVFSAQLAPVMIADEVVAVSVEPGYDEQAVLGNAASALAGTALDDGAVSERRLSPLAKAVMAAAEREGAEVTLPQAVVVGVLPNATADVAERRVALTVDGLRLNVAVDGQPAGALVVKVGRELYGHAIVSPGVRTLTPFFNLYGVVLLTGGAIYSAYIFLRKRIMPNRVLGNVLIAAGAMMPAMGGLLSRFGLRGYLYLGELLGAILIFAGFMAATNRPELAAARQVAEASLKGR